MRTTSVILALLCASSWLKAQNNSDPCTIEARISIGICIDFPCIPLFGYVSNGTEPYHYLWFNGEPNKDTYLNYPTSTLVDTCLWLQVTDAKGCVAFASVRYVYPGLPSVWGDTVTLGNDTLLLNATGGVFDLSINDHPFAQNYSIIQHPLHGTVTLNEDGSGSYTPEPGWCGPDHFRYSATDTSGCNAQHIATVSINLSPCAGILEEKSDCNDLCSGVANFYQSGVLTEPLSYVWSNGSTNSSAGNLCAGPVSVTVTDALGAEQVYTGNVAANTLQTAISGQQSVCNFSRIELNSQINSTSGTDYHFYWKGQGIYQSIQFEENPNFYCSSTSGTAEYKLFAVSSDGCQDSSLFIIEVMPNPVAKTSVFLPICSQDTLVIKSWIDKPGTPPYKYAWSGPGGAQSNWPDLIWDNPIAGQSGSYYLTLTDANGCTSRTSQYIAIPSNCNYTTVILENNNPYCSGSDMVLQYGMTPNWKIPDEVQWTGPNNFISNDANPTLTNVQTAMTGWYHVHLRFGDLMISDSALITISPNALDIVSTTIEPVTECFSPYDGKLTLEMSAPPPYQFRFTDEGNYVTYNNNPFIRTNVRQGLRQFEVLKNGCIVRSTIHVPAPDHPVVSVQQESCAGNDASISVSSSHPLNVSWTFPNGNGINNQTAQTNLIPGVYKLYMKDQTTNCVFNDTIVLEPYLHFGISVIDTPACDNSNGTLLVLPDNNIPQPVDFVWNTGAVNNPLENLAPGGYSVTVSDGIGCQRHQNVVLPPKEACIA
ncbi:MAG: hypothetical protein JNJ57_07325, partial [Saprospiraceae bacterium]|nr:hypothetical protein [Saprospiraceae bacterium]